MPRWLAIVGAGILCAVSLGEGLARGDEAFDVVSSTLENNAVTWRIERPNVKAPATQYPQITFQPGDRVTIDAGGCVQTGGRGRTWKRYVNPLGSNAAERYSALIDIGGTTMGMQRLQPWLGKPLAITRATTLTLGYRDDNYGDNGYWGHDNGNPQQCTNIGAAWLTVRIEHGAAPPPTSSPRYNEVYQRSAHNAYEAPKPPLQALLEGDKFRSLELDIHHSRMGVDAPADDFFVYHNALVSNVSSCSTLSKCLAQLRAWHERHPQHEVTTIFVDLKDPWVARHSGASLERQLRLQLAGLAYTPADLVESCPSASTLRAALKTCGWPTTDALRGKFIFALTGATRHLDAYAGSPSQAATRQSFIAPEIETDTDVASHENAVFFNLTTDHFTTGRAVNSEGFVSRVYYHNTILDVRGLNDARHWRTALNNQIHHIATDIVGPLNARFTLTQNQRGWPFACMLRDCSTMAEP